MNEIEQKMDWINTSPRGSELPIDCVHRYSYGKAEPDVDDIPKGWMIGPIENGNPLVKDFPNSKAPPITVDGKTVALLYLVDPRGVVRATWDEGRWWTPEESRAWHLMLSVPATYAVAEGLREQSMPRWYRRRKKRR